MDWLWAFVIIGGPIILGLALVYATLQYRKRGRHLDRASEESAKNVRDEVRRDDERARQVR